MALPIAPTPTLYGDSAREFKRKADENLTARYPEEEVKRALKIYLDCMKKRKGNQDD